MFDRTNFSFVERNMSS